MVQGYQQQNSGSSGGWCSLGGVPSDSKTGGAMLSVTGVNRFYYLCGFTDML